MIWTDPVGRQWKIVDFKRENLDPKAPAKRVPLGHWSAEGRSFWPHGWDGPIMLYDFGRIAYRETTDRILCQQLERTYREKSPTSERMDPRGPDTVTPP